MKAFYQMYSPISCTQRPDKKCLRENRLPTEIDLALLRICGYLGKVIKMSSTKFYSIFLFSI